MSDIFQNLNLSGSIFNFFEKKLRPVKSPPITHNYHVSLEQLCQRKIIKLKYTRQLLCNCFSENICNYCKGKGQKTTISQIGHGMIQQHISQCISCSGTGKQNNGCDKCEKGFISEEKIAQIHLTPEMENEYQYKFVNNGNQTDKSIEIGDFIVILIHIKNSIFQTINKDLLIQETISLKDALCGFTKDILHPNGENINIDTNGVILNNDIPFVIPTKGMTSSNNLIIKFSILFPKSLTLNQIQSLKNIL